MPEAVETKKVHFFHGLLCRPPIEGHSVGGDEDPRTIVSKAAVNKYLFFLVGEERKKLRDLLIGGRGSAANWNVDEAHSEGFGLFALLFGELAIFAAKINDGSDAKFFELFDAFDMRLCAAEERLCDFSTVGKASEFEFLAVRRAKHRSGSGRGRRLRAEGWSWKRKKNEK